MNGEDNPTILPTGDTPPAGTLPPAQERRVARENRVTALNLAITAYGLNKEPEQIAEAAAQFEEYLNDGVWSSTGDTINITNIFEGPQESSEGDGEPDDQYDPHIETISRVVSRALVRVSVFPDKDGMVVALGLGNEEVDLMPDEAETLSAALLSAVNRARREAAAL